ncbi:DUF4232 domain-containing protein [Streptomyces zingiberis]|uniref:DUF4232 domain-containing protein n=1 Tax=Streptomyces zingiberis TaxID=2053010 RepID=A0ABX1BX44_9ACTN|nr:DUF4232 domain-containing protein [Streptomyces zingiberis]NJQ00307.1 DUF4232 domain-containing protein [Streptomyces zingiberis]
MSLSRTAIATTAVLSLVGLAGGSAVASAGGSQTAAGAAEACQPGALRAATSDIDEHQVGMNHEGTYLKVTNVGDSACTFSGYPGLALEGAGHTAITTETTRGDTYFVQDPGEHEVTLQAGDSAYADLAWTHTGEDAVDARYLQISPTGSNSHSTVPFEKVVDGGALTVTAWSDTLPAS